MTTDWRQFLIWKNQQSSKCLSTLEIYVKDINWHCIQFISLYFYTFYFIIIFFCKYFSYQISFIMSTCPSYDSSGLSLVHWTSYLTDTCLYGNFQAVAWISQYFSIGIWVLAGTYQSYQLYKTKDVNGFSESFLICWIVGAILNTLGCICTQQMAFQIFLGCYFLISDTILYLQYKYYASRPWLTIERQIEEECEVLIAKNPRAPECLESARHKRASSISKDPIIASSLPSSCSLSSSGSSSYSPPQSYSTFTPTVVLGMAYNASTGSTAPIPTTHVETVTGFISKVATSEVSQGLTILAALRLLVGTTASWASNCLYIVSRIPQIRRNHIRKSCEGVSPALFIATVFANISYCLTIAGEWEGITDAQVATNFLLKELPFIFGAVSTTLADMYIFFQFYIYRDNDGVDYETLAAHCEGLFVEDNKPDRCRVIAYDSCAVEDYGSDELVPDMSRNKNKFPCF